MYVIETENLRLKLEVVPLTSLLQHEETLPPTVETLIWDFNNLANLQNPVIVDENHIVLDGNHRTYVFRKLGFRHIPVCKLDYFDERACILKYWFRLISPCRGKELLEGAVAELGGALTRWPDRRSLRRALERNPLHLGAQQGAFHASIRFPAEQVYDAVSSYSMLSRLQDLLVREEGRLEYIPCQSVEDAGFCCRLQERDLVIWTPHITKQMVVEAARQQKVFAPKTTRHLIPARPLNVNIPLAWFREKMSLEAVNQRFSDYLRKKKVRRFGPGQIVEGRYYEEELFVFYDE